MHNCYSDITSYKTRRFVRARFCFDRIVSPLSNYKSNNKTAADARNPSTGLISSCCYMITGSSFSRQFIYVTEA